MLTEKRLPGVKGGSNTGFFPGGKYVYEKKFTPKADWENKQLLLEFDGVYMNATIYLNGEWVGGRIYGYSHFQVDISDAVVNQENVLHVVVDNTHTPNSRWYSGSGIYRDVRLYVGEQICISHEGVKITTLSVDPAVIRMEANIEGVANLPKAD